MKVFLSHSTVDKAIVERIYLELGAGLCHFDAATFDNSGAISEEIFDALNSSSHFVLFASPTALSSGWVKGEMRHAFHNWMRHGVRRALVFLLDGATIDQVPDWLRIYIAREPPTWRHILCRIQTEIDGERKELVPPYFGVDVERLETLLLNVEASDLPGIVLVHGPDGSGRKRVINELYKRQFESVLSRKLLLPLAEYSSELEFYRELIGLTRIATPSEFVELFSGFEKLGDSERIECLVAEILKCTEGNQCIILDCDFSLLTEDARLPVWLQAVGVGLAGSDYPKLTVTTTRRPHDLSISVMRAFAIQEISALDTEKSQNLFNWWLRSLGSPNDMGLKDVVFEACSGSPKALELGARLLAQASGRRAPSVRPNLLRTLEDLSKQFLDVFGDRHPHNALLAFVANAGYVTHTDLLQYFSDLEFCTVDELNSAIDECLSHGFLIEDEVCLRMPGYLSRGARAIGRSEGVSGKISELLKHQAEKARLLSVDELTSVPVINEFCLAALRTGSNEAGIFENILLGSQCLRVARMMYDRQKYEESLRLCQMAHLKRATLTTDGEIETLRYLGLAAARLNQQVEFRSAIRDLEAIEGNEKATRIRCFLEGFNSRLDGRYDNARKWLTSAHKKGGAQDLHILRELAFLHLHNDDLPQARICVENAMRRAESNPYVLELALRLELVGEPAAVASRSGKIESLLDRFKALDISTEKAYWHQMEVEYKFALGEIDTAEILLDQRPLQGSESPAVHLLRARIQKKRKHYPTAIALLNRLRQEISKKEGGQRKSVLPIVLRLLIDCTAAPYPSEGAECFLTYYNWLPEKVAKSSARELLSAIAYTHATVPVSTVSRLKEIAAL